MAHTPGPWRILPNHPGDGRWCIATDSGVVEKVIVAPDDGWDSSYTDFTERQSNASLIAAAPELLAALKIAYEEMQSLRGYFESEFRASTDPLDIEYDQKCALISAAIAKAEGRSDAPHRHPDPRQPRREAGDSAGGETGGHGRVGMDAGAGDD